MFMQNCPQVAITPAGITHLPWELLYFWGKWHLIRAPQNKFFCWGLAYSWWPEPGFSICKGDFHFSSLTYNYLYLYYLDTSRIFSSLLRLQKVVLICILQMFGLSSRASRERIFSLFLIKTKTLNFHMEKHVTRSECFYYACRTVYKVLLRVSFGWHLYCAHLDFIHLFADSSDQF